MKHEWFYDEFKQKGTDYNNIDEVKVYDENMHELRDIENEIAKIIKPNEFFATCVCSK